MDHHTATLKDAEEAQSVIDEKLSDDPNLVTWTGPDNPANAHNWSTARKLGISGIWVYGNVLTTIASSIFSSGAGSVVKEFHVSPTVAILGVSFSSWYVDQEPLSSSTLRLFASALYEEAVIDMMYRDMQSDRRYGDQCPKGLGANGPCSWGYPCSPSSASL